MTRDKVFFHVCPQCGNVMVGWNKCEVECCEERLEVLDPVEPGPDGCLGVEQVEDELLVTSTLPQTKEDHISFVALVQDDRYEIVRQYPEWDVNVYLKKRGRGRAMLYFFRTGTRRLFRQQI